MQTRPAWRRVALRRVTSLARSSSGYLFLHTLRIALVFSSHRLRLQQKSSRVINFPCRVVNHGDARLLLQHGSVARAFPGSAPASARREGTTRPVFCHVALVYCDFRDRWQAAAEHCVCIEFSVFDSLLQSCSGHLKYITWHCMLAIFIYDIYKSRLV